VSFNPNALAGGDAADFRKAEIQGWSGAASPVVRENFDRAICFSAVVAIGATGVMASYGIPLYAGDVITSLACMSGNVGATTPTNWWFALYDTSKNLMAQTADQTTTAWAALTVKDIALATPKTITNTGIYYAAIMMKATTVNNLAGCGLQTGLQDLGDGLVTGMAAKAQTSGSGLTTTAPASIATPTNVIGIAHWEAH
jgi:hypothetical protein